eukprot:GHVL01010808.1.p1 GENE.GHVL01010808.1~~GHVL01010808.1.p1  ORF type:complete len:236 (+),score=27.34 GHVL01010808.1:427-1134(+)
MQLRLQHRDLKLENWLYESPSDRAPIKLIDFGFAKYHPETSKKMNFSCGSLTYASPDTLSGSYTNACDMWSLGVIVYMLLSGHPPFYGNPANVIKDIKKGRFSMQSGIWKNISLKAKDFISKLIEPDPKKRLTARDALQHNWLTERIPTRSRVTPEIIQCMREYATGSHMKRAALTMVALSLPTHQLTGLTELFSTFDSQKHGAIRQGDFADFLFKEFSIDIDEVSNLVTWKRLS